MQNQNENAPSRRQAMALGMKGVASTLALAPFVGGTLVYARNMLDNPTPGVTEGPYWVDEMLARSDLRSDPTTGIVQSGFPLTLQIRVLQITGKKKNKTSAIVGAYVDIWHCNALGLYSDEASENTSGEKFLRGYQLTNAKGMVGFTTIYPGWYSGRTPHIHVRVRLYDASADTVTYNFVTQMFFKDTITNSIYASTSPYTEHPDRDTSNAEDSIFTGASEDDEVKTEVGEDLMAVLTHTKKAAKAGFTILIDTTDSGYNNGLGGSSSTGTGPPSGGTPPSGGMPPTL